MTAPVNAHLCDWCGLPTSGGVWNSSEDVAEEEYCCFGCRFAARVTQDRGESGHVQWTLTRLGLGIFFTMNVMVFTMALWSRDVYGPDASDTFGAMLGELFRWLSFVASIPVLFLLGIPITAAAFVDLSRGRVTSDLLVASGVAAAFVFSVVSLLRESGPVYFEVPCMVLVLVTLGRWIEARSRLSAGQLLDSLDRLIPETSRLVTADGEAEVATDSLRPGDRTNVLAGERVPADGVLSSDASVSIDQQILTGESEPVLCHRGEVVLSGTVPVDAQILVRITRPAQQGTLSQILSAVREARLQRGRYQRLADRATTWFVPVVAVMACVAFGLHFGRDDIGGGIMAALAVTLIACPCALGLATSAAVWTALQRAATRGVLIRSGEDLESLAAIRAIRFDKTGTLTTGRPRVDRVVFADAGECGLVRDLAGAMARCSTHAYSRAIADWSLAAGESSTLTKPHCESVRTLSGLGLEARIASPDGQDRRLIWLGSRRLLDGRECSGDAAFDNEVSQMEASGNSVVLIGWDGHVRAAFALEESVRTEAGHAIDGCRNMGLDLGILSGDRHDRVNELGRRFDVAAVGELLPESKLAALAQVRSEFGPVLMVGDGINDGPALAGADVAVSLRSGTDLSRDASGVCLLHDDLRDIPWVIGLSRRTRRIIRQNLGWAFGYNAVGMLLATAGQLNPVIAAGLMFVSSVVVLGNSRRLAADGFEATHQDDHNGASRLLTDHAASDVEHIGNDSTSSAFVTNDSSSPEASEAEAVREVVS